MTGIVPLTGSAKPVSNPAPLSLLKDAVSADTAKIIQRVQALRNPSPLEESVSRSAGEKDLSERLFDALADVKVLTSRVAMHLDTEWRRKLFRQLDSLHDPSEWEAGDQPLRQESFETFLKAILSINPGRRPGLGLSSLGNLIAAWTADQDRLTIEFLPHDRVRWVLSRRQGDDEPERFAGDVSVDRLSQSLEAYNPEHWFTYAGQESKSA